MQIVCTFSDFQQKVIVAFEKKSAVHMTVSTASLSLKFTIPQLRKYDEFQSDDTAKLLIKLITDYIFYLDQYIAGS